MNGENKLIWNKDKNIFVARSWNKNNIFRWNVFVFFFWIPLICFCWQPYSVFVHSDNLYRNKAMHSKVDNRMKSNKKEATNNITKEKQQDSRKSHVYKFSSIITLSAQTSTNRYIFSFFTHRCDWVCVEIAHWILGTIFFIIYMFERWCKSELTCFFPIFLFHRIAKGEGQK